MDAGHRLSPFERENQVTEVLGDMLSIGVHRRPSAVPEELESLPGASREFMPRW
jgi:hypothetical protein